MLTFIKFGGSIITDKRRAETPDLATIRRLAEELRAARDADPALQVVLGHGSGSFGHWYAERYGVHRGIAPGGDWLGFALTSAAALRLNRIVVDELLHAGVPALSLQPSATLHSAGGKLIAWDTTTLHMALERRLVPVIHGDVAFDEMQGSAIISTEQQLDYLARDPALRPQQIILVGEAAVYTADPHSDPHAERIPEINAGNIDAVLHGAGASHGVDVTGGMRSKIAQMWSLVQAVPGLRVHLIGSAPDLLLQTLLKQKTGQGTVIVG